MAILTGALMYRGSFKSIRNYRNLYDSNTYAGEKGGANRDLILYNPAFARTRENMNEFGGCGTAVKAIRRGFQNLLPEQADAHFTGRLMRMTKEINLRDTDGVRGKRSIIFSANRSILRNMVFNTRVNLSEMMQCRFSCSHAASRSEAILTVSDLAINQAYVPGGATHFRIQHHLSIISDYAYSEENRRYEASCLLDGVRALEGSGLQNGQGVLNNSLYGSSGSINGLSILECSGSIDGQSILDSSLYMSSGSPNGVNAFDNSLYEHSGSINGLSAFGYSEFSPVLSALTTDILVSFPAGVILPEDCTVLQCIGVEFYIKSFGDVYLPLKGGCVKITDVF